MAFFKIAVRYTYVLLLVSMLGSCQKFLNVSPNNNLSGNNYWQSNDDYDKFALGLYSDLRTYLCDNTPFFMVTGEFRMSQWNVVSGQTREGNLTLMMQSLKSNDLKSLLASSDQYVTNYGYASIINWATWYNMIQNCNLLEQQTKDDPNNALNNTEKQQYIGEASFIRNLCYFFMVRIYGDVPYYTQAYYSDPMTRMPMTNVVNNAIADLKSSAANLPWTLMAFNSGLYSTRANKAAVYELIMNLDMWNATFDTKNSEAYYHDVDSIGNILINQNEGNYQLQPLTDLNASKELFRGFTKESIFTIPSNYNLGETFNDLAQMGTYTLSGINYQPNNRSAQSALYMNADDYLLKSLYTNTNDVRFRLWFGASANYTSTSGKFEFYKFYNIDQVNGGSTDSKIVFRLPDAILLRAEALNKLGNSADAIAMLNLVKNRAGLPAYSAGGSAGASSDDLQDEIIWERFREFIGEGNFFYDAVRTKAILNPDFFDSKSLMSTDAFNQRAWTWPLSTDVRTQNPNITLNTYWQ